MDLATYAVVLVILTPVFGSQPEVKTQLLNVTPEQCYEMALAHTRATSHDRAWCVESARPAAVKAHVLRTWLW